jgi:uncharacterized membrane protein
MVTFTSRTLLALASVTLLVSLAPGSARAAFSDPFYQSSFAAPDTIADWTITSGTWQFANGEFRSSIGALSIATVHTYDPALFAHDTIGSNFSLDVYGWIASGAANARAGAVFDFADAANYHEVTVSATGSAQLRSRVGGVSRTLASATVAAPGAGQWIHIALVRNSGRTTVWIDGVRAFDNVIQSGLPEGDVGLIARNTHARFDDIDARNFGRQDPYREDFGDGFANGWSPLSGSWSAASKIYTNTAVVHTAITQSPLNRVFDLGRASSDLAYTFKVRMLNPYGGSGNLVGVAWVRDAANYTEAVFSPTGQALLNKVASGVRKTLASAPYLGGSRNTWFEVEVGNANDPDEVAYIKVNGVPVFDLAPNVREGTLSLITHWAPGQFDNVRAAARFLSPVSENFDDGTAPQFAPQGTWNLQNGMFSSTAVVKAGRTFVQKAAGWHELADIEFRARMLNRFTTSGNLVGFTYGARGSVYYEAVFSPTGVAHLRKVVKDVPIPIATAPYEGGGRNQWFDAQLIQLGERTTVKVNGFTVFDAVLQPDAVGGDLGLVTHWTSASVDDVSLAQIPVTRYRFTQLPSLPGPVPSSGARALNDLGEVVGHSRVPGFPSARAVLWRNGRVIDLGAVFGDGSAANDINNRSEIVGDYFGLIGFHWKDGQLRDLPPFPGAPFERSEALGINERGQIVGTSCPGNDGCPAQVWEPDGRIITLEDLPGGINWGIATAINDRGEIVGQADGSLALGLEAVSWQGGTVERLVINENSGATDINNRGQIVGFMVRDAPPQLPVTWQNRELIVLPSRPRQTHGSAQAINEHGVIVGTTTIATPNPSLGLGTAASLWQEGRIVNLNEVLDCGPLPDSLFLDSALDINERGQIAANAFDFTVVEPVGFLLTPVLGEGGCDR